ncbi:MAG: MFS transporter [Armatimonadota bacterium]
MLAAARGGVPHAIRRNTWLLFLTQACLSTGLSTAAQLGSLIVYKLTGTAALAGLPTAINALSVASVGYPAGRFMDRRGRRPVLLVGFLVGALGAVLLAATVSAQWFAGYVLAVIVFSIGGAVGQLTRAAAADMYPTAARAAAVGLVVSGGLVGGVGGPLLVTLGERVARAMGADPLAVPWVFILAAFVIAAIGLFRLRPDPRDISLRLNEYYPEAAQAPSEFPVTVWGGGDAPPASEASVKEIIGSRPAQAAMIAMACAQATMNMLMATSSLMLSFHGHSMSTISLALMAHILGMFALSVPVGKLADRIGRRPVLVGGALLTASSGLMFTLGVDSAWIAGIAFYLVGLGWCLAFVSGAALLGDLSGPVTRARVLGLSDTFAHIAAVFGSLTSGVLLAHGGELTVGVLAAVLGSLPLLAILRAGRITPSAPAVVPVEGGK